MLRRSHNHFCFQATILAVLVLMIFSGCVDQIEFERSPSEILLVVQGRKALGKTPTEIKLGTSSPYGVFEPGEPIPFAKVSMFNHLGEEEILTEDPLNPGTYRSEGEMIPGIPGHAYHIEIQLDNGDMYRSIPDTMPNLFRVDQAYFKLTEYEFFNEFGFLVNRDRIQVFIDTSFPLTQKGPYFRWLTQEVWRFSEADKPWDPLYFPKTCYVKEITSPQYLPLYNGDIQETSKIEEQLVAFTDINYSFLEKHYFNIYQMSLSAEAYAYWERVDRVSNQVGTIFDAPPAPIRSNIYNIADSSEVVLGFFETAAIDTARFFTLPRDFPDITIFDICEPDFRFSPPRFNRTCENCLMIPDSQLERPDYF
jgi:hypothetical protein